MVDPDAPLGPDARDAGGAPGAGAGDVVTRDPDDDLPVVARLVIEIRSDGSRTVARGALEQAELGERVGVEARGGSPAALAADLLRAIVSLPLHSTLSRWTGRDGQVPKASLEVDAGEPAPGLVGRARQALTSRLRRKLGLSR